MPALDDLAARFAAKGVGEGTRAVLYSRGSMQWATRVWWMLRAVGFDDAAVLDGGFDKWSAEGRPTETAETRYPAATLAARPRPGLFVGKEEVRAAIGDAGACTVNALAPDLHRATTRATAAPAGSPGASTCRRRPWWTRPR
jgi:thiosulfate/3-mercaptopyruvate sulfurtransferase